jgi:hypothetical protein
MTGVSECPHVAYWSDDFSEFSLRIACGWPDYDFQVCRQIEDLAAARSVYRGSLGIAIALCNRRIVWLNLLDRSRPRGIPTDRLAN